MKVLKFGAMWCPGCLIMKPRWAEIEQENPWVEAEFYDIDENSQKAQEYKIDKVVPVFVFLDKNNNEILRLVGEHSKKELLEILNEHRDK